MLNQAAGTGAMPEDHELPRAHHADIDALQREADSFIDGREVSRLTGYSKSTRARGIKAGTFPAPVIEGAKNLWSLREIKSWQSARFAEREERTRQRVKPLSVVRAA